MTSEQRSLAASGADELAIADLIEEFAARLQTGKPIDVDSFAAEHPTYADRLRELLPGVQVLAELEPAGSDADSEENRAASRQRMLSGVLGDFRILREVGKGGMGVVYEAEQISLRRRVALKILPFAATMDLRHLQRFHNEAQAAACLHHTNIVPVFFVGCERGVHFYAMQFIEGQPLSDLIRQIRQREKKIPTEEEVSTPLPAGELTARTDEVRRGYNYYRKATELGIQAAEALDHAHQLGIVHRDIKPGNLMLDGRGNLWVTDFGLAQVQNGAASLTMTGQAVGTPRYMSPEQASAKRTLIDHRTDVYSLAATLYELLTLHPAFEGEDRQELLRQIVSEEPAPPRRHDKAIPTELETIVLKAMAKNPDERYATAKELAEDLRRWLEDRPIRARRSPVWTRLIRWGRRQKTLVVSAATAALMGLAVLAGSIGWIVRDQEAMQTKRIIEAQNALRDAEQFRTDGKLAKAQAEAKRAKALLNDGTADPTLDGQVQSLLRELAEEEADSQLVASLGKIRLRQADVDVKGNRFLIAKSRPDYQQAFQSYGMSREMMTPEAAAARLQARPARTRATHVAALDHWLILARFHKAPEADWLERVLSLADTDSWRQRLRAARLQNDLEALEQLAAEVDPATQPPESLFVLDFALRQRRALPSAVALLQRTQQVYPADFWVNLCLGQALQRCQPPQYDEAIRFLTVAAALRPDSAGVWLNLGLALGKKGRIGEALIAFRKALALEPDYTAAHYHLGRNLLFQGRLDEAIAACRRALDLGANWPEAPFFLGNALANKGQLAEAVTAYRRAIEQWPDYAEAYCNLGSALRQQGKLVPSLAAYEQGHALGIQRPNWPYPSAQWVQKSRRLVELARQLPAILRGAMRPASAVERSEFAELCHAKQHYLAAARFWADAFAADPKLAADLESQRREQAVCAAALAASGQGEEASRLNRKERSRWRKQALQWLRDELSAQAKRLQSRKPQERRLVRQRLGNWQCERELASLRDPAVVAQMPADEKEACRQFWAEVEAMLKTIDAGN